MKQITSTYNNYFKVKHCDAYKSNPQIIVDDKITYQTHLGFGGAFTDAACSIFEKLNEEQKTKVLDAYFSKDGLNYNLGRLTIGSCDFATADYDYAFKPDCSDFSLDYDKKHILPFVLKALQKNDITFMASPWSPPKMFKTTNEKCRGGYLKENSYDDYAKYLTLYLKHMKQAGIEISLLSIQNEPEAVQSWESCIYTPQNEMKLGKKIYENIQKEKLNTKLLFWDHNRDVIVERVQGYYEDDKADEIIYGFAYHWYEGYCSNNLKKVHDMHPSKHLIFTEGCIELLGLNPQDPSSASGTMKNALRYAKNYILDSLNYTEGFIDWNLLLDQKGGPNHVGNYCEALIMFDTKTKELHFNPSYYIVKHFAHFVEKGAKRIDVKNQSELLVTSYKNPNGQIIVVIANEGASKETTIQVKGITYKLSIDAESVTTLVI